jgi:hypothetical protein
VTRADLEPAQQAVQAAHAALQYAAEHPGGWHEGALVLLALPSCDSLWDLAYWLDRHGDAVSLFREPDLADELTAIAAGPSAGRMLRHVPLAFSDGKEVR